MRFSSAIVVAGAASANAALQGFNYGAGLTTGAAKTQQDFETDFKRAQNLPGTSGWNAARLYTSIQTGSQNDPIAAIPAAIATNTKLLLGIWASAGQEAVTNELAAIDKAIQQYGSKFTDLVVGLSCGSEDLYRVTATGIKNKAGIGAGPDVLLSYIKQIKAKNWGFSIGHVDTWTAWTNSSNNEVIEAIDWLGYDGYPYFETDLSNSIDNAKSQFDQSFGATKGASMGKPVWMTESGWPVSGPTSGQAEASVDNAERYWQEVACMLIESDTPTFWYTLRDAEPSVPSPSFGIIGQDVNSDPLYDLSCSAKNSTSSSASSSATSAMASSAMASGTATATATEASTTASGSSSGESGSPGVAPLASASPSSGSSGSGSSGSGSSGSGSGSSGSSNSTSPSYMPGSPSAASPSSTGSMPAQYSTGAASSNGLSAIAAIAAIIGLVVRA
ncbi:unnamed protein product [Zymoseptoria tritici ST99CH_1E4]|uniref:Probable glucan endo-1,3-beta-glucosidase eglC n=2 Tax=Zymoseptoria tritici TaxID=1047171 RepID=F9X0V3_ZYMTI|nr:putative Exo-beta-1,3-glucanase [Zymoseptoria tritici IPO323]EGP92443.1 putative Exo-beta-1,3-glucanase [Zymoseptoria tritici IPO323]SMR42016.1 unnamed protein product [Zymoseptoria tritici ST99CH_1E4]